MLKRLWCWVWGHKLQMWFGRWHNIGERTQHSSYTLRQLTHCLRCGKPREKCQ